MESLRMNSETSVSFDFLLVTHREDDTVNTGVIFPKETQAKKLLRNAPFTLKLTVKSQGLAEPNSPNQADIEVQLHKVTALFPFESPFPEEYVKFVESIETPREFSAEATVTPISLPIVYNFTLRIVLYVIKIKNGHPEKRVEIVDPMVVLGEEDGTQSENDEKSSERGLFLRLT